MECIGIDLGSAAIVAGHLLPSGAVDVLVTPTGGRSVTPAVSFQGKRRHVGQVAAGLATSNMRSTITDCLERLPPTQASSQDEDDSVFVTRVPHKRDENGVLHYTVQYELNGQTEATFSSAEVLAMLLVEVTAPLAADAPHTAVVAVPDEYNEQARQLVADACVLASEASGKQLVFHVAGAMACLRERFTQRYAAKANSGEGDDAGAHVIVADVGKAFSSVGVGRHAKGTGALELLHTSSLRFGCDDLDAALAKHVLDLLARKNVQVVPSSRAGLRVLKECGSARKVLSANRSATVVLESFGPNDANFHFDISRETFEGCCADAMQRFRGAIAEALQAGGVADGSEVEGVELVGGATCIPAVQQALADAVGGDEAKLRCTLDRSSSVAIGATLLAGKVAGEKQGNGAAREEASSAAEKQEGAEDAQGKGGDGEEGQQTTQRQKEGEQTDDRKDVEGASASTAAGAVAATWSSTDEARTEAVARLKQVLEQDAFIRKIADARNTLEAYVLNAKTLGEGPHGELFNRDKTQPLLDEALDWIDSDEAHEAATPEPFVQRYEDLKAKVEAINAEMFEKIRADEEERAKKEKEEQEQWARERASEEKEDHDFRKLPKEKRMQQVMRNKNEATELFKGGNYSHATARYARALAHTSKFFDLSAEDEKEVNDIKCVLHLNLAMCYIKQQSWKKALSECDEALALDGSSAKGLYRKALVLEKMSDFEGAAQVAKRGLAVAPEDAGMTKLAKRVEAKKAKAMEQQKQRLSKMFA